MLKEIPLASIKVLERTRIDKGDIAGLAATIQEKGLIQPITVDQDKVLLAGERRYLAFVLLKRKTIPAIIRKGDTNDAVEIEMIENTARKDLTWVEKANLDKKIYDRRAKKNAAWSNRDQAKLTHQAPATIDRRIRLAEAMELLPELADFGTEDEAWKSYKRLEEGEVVKMTKTTKPPPTKPKDIAASIATTKKEKRKDIECDKCGYVHSCIDESLP